ncbi:hypothetical protein [Halalkalibacter lacteus]|uniref:hypothetical protein n=1 Tax=Halalkalibacter lacteus TaxID=3090663 RepID=UPI002FC73BDB
MSAVKVLLPKKVAIALESVIGERGKSWAQNLPAVSNAAKSNRDLKVLVDYIKVNESGYETLQAATYVGYKVDASPEEKLCLYYHEANSSERKGIKATLDILNIAVKGID